MPEQSSRRLVSFGAFLDKGLTSQIKEEDRPDCDYVRWTKVQQLHMAWQGFFRSKENVNFAEVQHELEKLEKKFFPMLVNLYCTNIMPNKTTPSSLMWNIEILEIKKERHGLEQKIKDFGTALKDCMQKVCVIPPSTQVSPHVILGRFPKNTPGDEVEHLERIQVPQSKVMLEKLDIIEAIKAEKSLDFKVLDI